MNLLRIILTVFGAILLLYGTAVLFLKKYYLAKRSDEFDDDYVANVAYAKRVGVITFIAGIVTLPLAITTFFLDNIYSLVVFCVCIGSTSVSLLINQLWTSYKKEKL